MIKKHKNLFKYFTISLVFVILMMMVGNVYSDYNPTRDEFNKAEASSLLRKKITISWKIMDGP